MGILGLFASDNDNPTSAGVPPQPETVGDDPGTASNPNPLQMVAGQAALAVGLELALQKVPGRDTLWQYDSTGFRLTAVSRGVLGVLAAYGVYRWLAD